MTTSREPSDVTPESDNTDSESTISKTSFKRWHKRMQTEHLRLKRSSFTLWKCCEKTCRPCRWFDSIDYEKKICKCCLKFRTFKTLGTIVLMAMFLYIFSYSVLGDRVLPGGTVFYLFVLFIAAFIAGYIIMLVGLPGMFAHILIGIIFQVLPLYQPPREDRYIIEEVTEISEEILLVIALIRAGLLLDMSRIKLHVSFIFRLAFYPFICEFILLLLVCHFLLSLPWDWSVVQGSVLSVVSLASITSVLQKNKAHGYGEEKDLCTVLIAAAALNVISGLFLYAVSITYLLPESRQPHDVWRILLIIIEEIGLGLAAGAVAGLLISFFPDKRNTEAAALRILMIGIGAIATANIFSALNMVAAAGLSCLGMCVVAANMWEELGWHKDDNPVQYFYSMLYYFSQPIALSLIGYTMNFKEMDATDIGQSIALILSGLVLRDAICYATTTGSSYPLNLKERLYICIAWLSKGTFQMLLSGAIYYIVIAQKSTFTTEALEENIKYARVVHETTVIAILLTTPFVYFTLTILTPVLLTRHEPDEVSLSRSSQQSRKRRSSSRLRRYP